MLTMTLRVGLSLLTLTLRPDFPMLRLDLSRRLLILVPRANLPVLLPILHMGCSSMPLPIPLAGLNILAPRRHAGPAALLPEVSPLGTFALPRVLA